MLNINTNPDFIISREKDNLFNTGIPTIEDIAELIAAFEWLHTPLYDWLTPGEAQKNIREYAANQAEILHGVLCHLQPSLPEIRSKISFIDSETDSLQTSTNIPALFHQIENLSTTAISILLSFITGVSLQDIIQIGPINRKEVFLVRFPGSRPLVFRYWKSQWGFINQRFSEPLEAVTDQTSLNFLSEPAIHKLLTHDYAPLSTQLPFLPIDVCERVIPFSEFSDYIGEEDSRYVKLLELVAQGRRANPYGTHKHDDWGLALRNIDGAIFAQVVHFDWSDPQYSDTRTVGDIQRQKPQTSPVRIPIEILPEEMYLALLGM